MRSPLVLTSLIALAVACTTPPAPPPPPRPTAPSTAPPSAPQFSHKPLAWRLVLVHFSDSEAGLLPDDAEPEIGGIARSQTVLKALKERAGSDAVVVAVGDLFIPSPELQLEIDGKSAVLQGNNMLLAQASALGNHELDLGEQFLADAIAIAEFPYLTATLRVTGGPLARVALDVPPATATPWAHEIKGKLAPRAKVCAAELGADGVCKGLVVGLVGATTEELRLISAGASANLAVPNDLAGVRDAIQPHVDALAREGVRVIVLLSHLQGAQREAQLISEAGLTGVDVVLAGGGENRLASTRHRLAAGDKPDRLCGTRFAREPCYPTTLTAKDGKPVLLAATAGDMRYVGNLIAKLDEDGVLTGYHEMASRPWPVDEESLLELRASADKKTLAYQQRVRAELAPLLREVARSDVVLEGKREDVRNRETNLGDISADAIAAAAPAAAAALRNGGGIRGSVNAGAIRLLDLKTALRFDSAVVVVELTHEQLVRTLESSLRGAGSSRGHFPQVSSAVKLVYTTNAPEQTHELKEGRVARVVCPGARIRQLSVGGVDVVKDGKLPTPKAKISVATLEYLANGGDGWFPGDTVKAAKVDGATEQSTLRAFLEKHGTGEYREVTGRITRVDDTVPPSPDCAHASP